jgi:hypothetical protein
MKKLLLVSLALLSLPLFVERVSACSCAHGISLCETYQKTSAVFVGRVSDSKRISTQYELPSVIEGKKIFFLYSKVYRVSVEKVFKGINDKEIELITNDNGSDCGYFFHVNERYLIYANAIPSSNQLHVSACSRTTLYSKASQDLDYIRGLPDSATKTRVSGIVYQERTYKPLKGIEVILAAADKRFEVFTNSDGVYKVIGLPPGRYKVWAVLPDKRITIDRVIDIAVGGCATLEIEARPYSTPSGKQK